MKQVWVAKAEIYCNGCKELVMVEKSRGQPFRVTKMSYTLKTLDTGGNVTCDSDDGRAGKADDTTRVATLVQRTTWIITKNV